MEEIKLSGRELCLIYVLVTTFMNLFLAYIWTTKTLQNSLIKTFLSMLTIYGVYLLLRFF